MRLLHTSDWHLDAKLEQLSRSDEQQKFLNWLRGTILEKQIDVLLVAGDIFDSGNPSNSSQLRYNQFLRELYLDAKSGKSVCKTIIITAGNHDSPSLLNVSGPFMELLGMHVVTQPTENLREMIIPVLNSDGQTEALIAAVPFLRGRDLVPYIERTEELELAQQILNGMQTFYRIITDEALKMRSEILEEESQSNSTRNPKPRLESRIPIIATGHLFTAHGSTLDGDGVLNHRGTLDQFPASGFPPELSYIALGHLHQPQRVDGKEYIRYSGAPITMNFSEAGISKQVLLVETEADSEVRVTPIPVPTFQRLEVLKGDFSEIESSAKELPAEEPQIWIKAVFTGETYELSLRDQIEELFQTLPHLQLVSFENQTAHSKRVLDEISQHEDLLTMKPQELFDRFLAMVHSRLADSEKQDLNRLFEELLVQYENRQIEDGIE
ncbi:MAG: exonuclease SbcCD subunit D C-terminal domain-containing protein [Thermoguttaceae bacterium]|nr:exonuclease SbcCD subunit D C-terminal domain-containing protein [Thermoguttaceae bacterium]